MPEEEEETLGPCGCVDYHMADCPIRTGEFMEDYFANDYCL